MRQSLIAVVDDDAAVRRTTALLIEAFGFHAAAFESAESFLRSDQVAETSCLVADVEMPGMNGLELQTHLAAAGRSIPIIFITAYDTKESRQRAMQAGAIAFLTKPFREELLLQNVRIALRHDDPGVKTT
jgi:FixJ family two-component response regulator